MNYPKLHHQFFGAPRSSENSVVVYLHGFPGSLLEGELLHAEALRRNITILSVDRPGFGESENWSGRKIIDFPTQLKNLLAQQDISSCNILAVSGGAPYALASAAVLPQLIRMVLIISGFGEVSVGGLMSGMIWQNRMLLRLASVAPFAVRPIVASIVRNWQQHPAAMVRYLARVLKNADREVLARRELALKLSANMQRGLMHGAAGAYSELKLLVSRFHIDYRAISMPVLLWHGDDDLYVPESHAQYYHAQIPGSKFRIISGGGHFMAVDLGAEALETLVS